jgi:hypothetical protein
MSSGLATERAMASNESVADWTEVWLAIPGERRKENRTSG